MHGHCLMPCRLLADVPLSKLPRCAPPRHAPHTKGEFIARFGRAVSKMPKASLDECALGTADWASLPDASEAYEIAHRWIASVTLSMLAEHGTRSAKRIGWLMYAAAGHGTADTNGKDQPLQLVLKRVRGMTIDAQVGNEADDVAVAACEIIGSRECPLPLLVYRPVGPLRRAAAIAEIDSSQTREQV